MPMNLNIKNSINQKIRLSAFHLNHLLKKYDKTLWLIGDGRSGTTWVSNLINHDTYFREMFEPFHPEFVEEMDFISSHYYLSPDEINEKFRSIANQVFSGKLFNLRTDQDNSPRIYKGLFIKDIFANLLSNWVYQNHSDIKITLLVRNPFAVASSKYAKRDWNWVSDPYTLLKQQSLKNDYLLKFEDLIHEVCREDDYILKQILIWSIIHYVPFKQFKSDQIHVMFYENVFLNPQQEISELSKFINKPFTYLSDDIIKKPSKVVGDNINSGKSPINSWMNTLPSSTIDKGMHILEQFGLDNLYDSNSLPNAFDIDQY